MQGANPCLRTMTILQDAKRQKYNYTKRVEKWMRKQPASYWKGNLEYEKHQNMINLIVVEQRLFGYD